MHPLIARLAIKWVIAERSGSANDTLQIANDALIDQRITDADELFRQAREHGMASAEELAIASDRVMQVIAGEVRWSEASPGDRAVWKGRFKDVEKFARWVKHDDNTQLTEMPEIPLPPAPPEIPNPGNVLGGVPSPPRVTRGPRLVGYRERLWWNYYDTIQIRPGVGIDATAGVGNHDSRYHMFGNQNIGRFELTNMMTGNQIGNDCTFVITAWWATCSAIDALGWFADKMQFEILIGNKPCSPRTFGRDLFMGIPFLAPYGRPLMVPVRQIFGVCAYQLAPVPVDVDITVHLDGLVTREIQ